MAKCTDCLHCDACLQFYKLANGGEPIALGNVAEEVCENFKDQINYVEVVRCKDCKYFAETNGKDSGKPCGYGKCMKPFFIQMIVDAEDFCSYGKRREEE